MIDREQVAMRMISSKTTQENIRGISAVRTHGDRIINSDVVSMCSSEGISDLSIYKEAYVYIAIGKQSA